jgi:lysophospholipase L1-like esterase
MTPQFGWKKTVLYSLLPMVVFLGLLEGSARVAEIWFPPWNVDYGWGFDPDSRLFVPSPEDPRALITNPPKTVSFHEQRFYLPKPERIFRVFTLGGSSVNYILGDLKMLGWRLTWRYRGQRLVEFIDCGGLSYGSHRLVAIASEILNYEPDLVLIYSGHNEFEELDQVRVADLKHLPLQRIIYRSAFLRFLRDRMAAVKLSAIERERNRQVLANPYADYLTGGRHAYTPEEVTERAGAFENNLSIIASLCQSKGVPVIIGTVASNLWEPGLATPEMMREVKSLYEQGQFEEGLALARKLLRSYGRHQASDTENEIIRAVAARYNLPLADVEAAVRAAEPHRVPGETLFKDICHLNNEGNRILIKAYEEQIIRLLDERTESAKR